MTQKSAVNIVFGCMTFGTGAEQSRISDLAVCGQILDIFRSHGHTELDTARLYGRGTSEEFLGKLDTTKRGLAVATKIYPTRVNAAVGKAFGGEEVSLTAPDLRKQLMISLKSLQLPKIDLWYLHGPDRQTPMEDTLREVNNLYKEGYFTRFGISNYMSWEVAQMCAICDKNGWVKPVVYQGLYNALHRGVEPELFPCLRAHKIAFYAYNPLGGGFFTGNFSKDSVVEEGSRFDPEKAQGKMYRQRYWNDMYFKALELIKPVAEKHGIKLAEVALRWMMHHSLLKREFNDAVLIGASSTKHIEQNLLDFEKGPLPEEIVTKLAEASEIVKAVSLKYWH